ncbi:MAG: TrmH family RNA methyltransferase [Bacteroidia bacterium]
MKPTNYVRDISERRAEKFRKVLNQRQKSLTVVLENIHDPHNISAILRSCDAVGVFDVFVINTAEFKSRKLGRKSSASAKKWVNVYYYDTVEECFAELRKRGLEIWVTHLSKDAKDLYQMDMTRPIALVFGNEKDGVTQQAVDLADGNFLIPMAGMIQSLNVSVACAVTLYEAFRQRRQKDDHVCEFTVDEQAAIFHEWSHK